MYICLRNRRKPLYNGQNEPLYTGQNERVDLGLYLSHLNSPADPVPRLLITAHMDID